MKFRMTLSGRSGPLSVLSPTGEDGNDEAVRQAMLDAFYAGQLKSVQFNSTVWTDGPNKNDYFFPEPELKKFAKSFAGRPFIKDHDYSQDARGGTIQDSSLVTTEDGALGFRQRIKAVKPWAIEGVLDGTIDTFSIGWCAEEHICTVCNIDILDCRHGPWMLGKKDAETGKTVGILWKGLSGVETSAVIEAAAPGTTTEEVMAGLASLSPKWKNASGNPAGAQESEDQMLEKILSFLGLPAGSSEEQVLSALEALKAIPKAASKAVLTVLGMTETATEAEIVGKVMGICAPGAFIPKAEHDKVVDELAGIRADAKVDAALAAGKLTLPMEAWARAHAKANPEGFDSLLANLPQQVPTPASGVEMPNLTSTARGRTLSPEQVAAVRQFGLTPEEFLAAQDKVAQYDARIAALYN